MMDMWGSARSFTLNDLRKAFEAYAEHHGKDTAVAALERSTGVREVWAVPRFRIINGMVEFVGGYSFEGSGKTALADDPSRRIASIHERFSDIRQRAFVKR